MKTLCEQCGGKCCKSNRLYIQLAPFADKNIPEEMIEKNHFLKICILKKKKNGDCIAFKDGLCTIHESRPIACRKFEMGGDRCLTIFNGD